MSSSFRWNFRIMLSVGVITLGLNVSADQPKCADVVFKDLQNMKFDFGTSFEHPSDKKEFVDYKPKVEELKKLFAERDDLQKRVDEEQKSKSEKLENEQVLKDSKVKTEFFVDNPKCPGIKTGFYSGTKNEIDTVIRLCREVLNIDEDLRHPFSDDSSNSPTSSRNQAVTEQKNLRSQIPGEFKKLKHFKNESHRLVNDGFSNVTKSQKDLADVNDQIEKILGPLGHDLKLYRDEQGQIRASHGEPGRAEQFQAKDLDLLPDGRWDFWGKYSEAQLTDDVNSQLAKANSDLIKFLKENKKTIDGEYAYEKARRQKESLHSETLKKLSEGQMQANQKYHESYQNIADKYNSLEHASEKLENIQRKRDERLNKSSSYRLSIEVKDGAVKKYILNSPYEKTATTVDLNSDCSVHSFYNRYAASPEGAYRDKTICDALKKNARWEAEDNIALCNRYNPQEDPIKQSLTSAPTKSGKPSTR